MELGWILVLVEDEMWVILERELPHLIIPSSPHHYPLKYCTDFYAILILMKQKQKDHITSKQEANNAATDDDEDQWMNEWVNANVNEYYEDWGLRTIVKKTSF